MPSSVHPHACGEHSENVPAPRPLGRFIPTRVGNMLPRGDWCARPAVHPHACGEHNQRIQIASCFHRFIPTRVGNIIGRCFNGAVPCGSSPRVWGTCQKNASICTSRSVHPHACGEHLRDTGAKRGVLGSSPRVWGTSTPRCLSAMVRPVHPHACGEHHVGMNFVRFAQRFIPTRVGNIGV